MTDKLTNDFIYYVTDIEQLKNSARQRITPKMESTVMLSIVAFFENPRIKKKQLKLSSNSLENLIHALTILCAPPRPLSSKKPPRTSLQKSKGIKESLILELNRLHEALKLSDAAADELKISFDIAAEAVEFYGTKKEDQAAKIFFKASPVSLCRIVRETIGVLEDTTYPSVAKNNRKNHLPYYFTDSILAYKKNILEENPSAGYSSNGTSGLYLFMFEIVKLFEPQ